MATIANLLPGSSLGGSEEWPNLPTKNFIAGRAASQDDVNEGRAIFVLAQGGIVIGRPIDITIPQYALMDSGPSKPPIRVVVIQAEEFPKGKLVGVRDARGKEYVAKLSDLQLLGQSRPR